MQFSRTQELHRQALQVNDVVQDALRLIHPLLRNNISLAVDLDEDLPLIYGDSPQIEQVLVNLIVNAVDAMPDGGHLRVSTARSQELQKASGFEDPQGHVCISITDSGVGIPDELQSAIFEPFFTTKPAGKGTGLGLSSSYGIVRQHNGRIEVQSKPGYGSTFNVFFPMAGLSA
jgi:signal transduction histidine kinase